MAETIQAREVTLSFGELERFADRTFEDMLRQVAPDLVEGLDEYNVYLTVSGRGVAPARQRSIVGSHLARYGSGRVGISVVDARLDDLGY